ncbi:MAG: lipocalin family protein [Alistipes sp.]|nr:lipocalin family protein [Alistipes sp.]
MKKLLLLLIAPMMLLSYGCDKEKFIDAMKTAVTYEQILGTWEGTGIYYDGDWIDPTSNLLYSDLRFTITFYDDGRYYGSGFFGTGSGTYTLKGNKIYTYVNGDPYLNYTIDLIVGDWAELTMHDKSGNSLRIRVTKM